VKVTLITKVIDEDGPLLPEFEVEPSPPRLPLGDARSTVLA
jgi:hypothetical protein